MKLKYIILIALGLSYSTHSVAQPIDVTPEQVEKIKKVPMMDRAWVKVR